MWWEKAIRNGLKEIGNLCEGLKSNALNKLAWKKSFRSYVELRQLGAANIADSSLVVVLSNRKV